MKKRRTDLRISLRKLEKMTGISRSTLSRIESGKRSPTLDELEALAIVLKCEMSDLYKREKM
ncbi:MAG: helix-turn-helix transcriptional regulator [Eubacteriales bacterium]|nr:helix-turn-helix transcriptional regulator [Eubacteriales bacterium]